jgi:hypothetical protein
MYKLFKFDKWPFRMLLYRGDDVLIEISRYAEGTRDTLETVEQRPENVTQLQHLDEMIERANSAAQLQAERDEYKYKVNEAMEVARGFAKERDELSDNLNRALNDNRAMIGKLEQARAELHFFHGAFPQATRNYKALSEWESETPFGQALDGMGDEVQE